MAVPFVAAEAAEGAAASSAASAARTGGAATKAAGRTKTVRAGEMATEFPSGRRAGSPAPAKPKSTPPATEHDEPDDDGDDAVESSDAGGRRLSLPSLPGGGDAAGFLLGALAYGWVLLPLLTGGPAAVKNVLRAKFFNKGPKGEWLP